MSNLAYTYLFTISTFLFTYSLFMLLLCGMIYQPCSQPSNNIITDKLCQSISRTDVQIATILHRERMDNFYSTLGKASNFISHSACFSCLRGLPEFILPCGHILCQPCVQAYGRNTSRTTIEISRCPLHVREALAKEPYVFSLKPSRAGVRILSLDR